MTKLGIPYTLIEKTNRKYWGRQTTYKNEKNILDDPIDGIDSTFDIVVNDKICRI